MYSSDTGNSSGQQFLRSRPDTFQDMRYRDYSTAGGLDLPSAMAASSSSAGWPVIESSGIYPGSEIGHPWNVGPASFDSNNVDMQRYPSEGYGYQNAAVSPTGSWNIYGDEIPLESNEFDDIEELEFQKPYVVLLPQSEVQAEDGSVSTTPWIHLWKSEEQDIQASLIPTSTFTEEDLDVKLERARYVQNPEMQAAKAFYNALQLLRRTVKAKQAELSPHLRTHHEKTNCEEEMLLSFREYDAHARECSNCCSALISLKYRTPLCEFGLVLAKKVFLSVDWYATATFGGDYETVTLPVSDHTVQSLLLAFTQREPLPTYEPEEVLVENLPEDAPVQTLTVESLGIITSFIRIEKKTSANKFKATDKKRKRGEILAPMETRITTSDLLWSPTQGNNLLASSAEMVVSTLDEYLNSPSRRRALRSQIGQEGMCAIRRLFNVSLHGYHLLERAFTDGTDEDHEFYHHFPNHTELLSLGVQTFIELSNEKPSYPTALREVYSILHLCDSINQIMPQQRHERERRVESFSRELKDWRDIIENRGERTTFEHIIQVRWPSPYLEFPRQSLPSRSAKRKRSEDGPLQQNRVLEGVLAEPEQVQDGFNHMPKVSQPLEHPSFDPVGKALLWMQLIAGIVFTTIAAYFSLNHRIVNVLILYFTGGDWDTLNSSRTIETNTSQLPNSQSWISTSSIKFINKVRGQIIDKLKVPQFEKFSHAVEVAMDSLSCGWISNISTLESFLLRMAKLVECTKLEFYDFTTKVLDLCLLCAAKMPACEPHRVAPKGSLIKYNKSYKQSRFDKESESWLADEDEDVFKKSLSARKDSLYEPEEDDEALSGAPSPGVATYGSSISPSNRIQKDFLDYATMPFEEQLVSDTSMARGNHRTFLSGEVTAYPGSMPAPLLAMNHSLGFEDHENHMLGSSHHHHHHHHHRSLSNGSVSKSYSHPSNLGYSHQPADSYWSPPPRINSTISDYPSNVLAPTTWHNIHDDLLQMNGNHMQNPYMSTLPTTIPASLVTTSMPTSLPTSMSSTMPSMPSNYVNLNSLMSGPMGSPPIPTPYPLNDEHLLYPHPVHTPPPSIPALKPRRKRPRSIDQTTHHPSGTSSSETGEPPAKRRLKKIPFFRCPMCKNQIAAPRMNLTRHMRTVHAGTNQPKIECEWPGCKVTFQAARKDNYRAHLRKHQEKLGEAGN